MQLPVQGLTQMISLTVCQLARSFSAGIKGRCTIIRVLECVARSSHKVTLCELRPSERRHAHVHALYQQVHQMHFPRIRLFAQRSHHIEYSILLTCFQICPAAQVHAGPCFAGQCYPM